MKIDGIWEVEIMSQDGWERVGTAFLKDGNYLAASANHYSTGKYKVNKDKFQAKFRLVQFGEKRTVFGVAEEKMKVELKGVINNKGEIAGEAHPTTGEDFKIRLRMTRQKKWK